MPLVKRLEAMGGVKTMFLSHRDDIVITTKVGYDISADRRYPGQSERPHDWEPASVRRQVEDSLLQLFARHLQGAAGRLCRMADQALGQVHDLQDTLKTRWRQSPRFFSGET